MDVLIPSPQEIPANPISLSLSLLSVSPLFIILLSFFLSPSLYLCVSPFNPSLTLLPRLTFSLSSSHLVSLSLSSFLRPLPHPPLSCLSLPPSLSPSYKDIYSIVQRSSRRSLWIFLDHSEALKIYNFTKS